MRKTEQEAHNWVKVASLLVDLHSIWSVKSKTIQPLIYGSVLIILLVNRKTKYLKPFGTKLNNRTKTNQNKKKLA
jgi:sulfoxide reductase heme-binding subunit YedZ